ncbi:hypothetical protein [Pseudaquabacterium pictum]|uniref:hypothetical protein n=1 Tax=Pseudaquabacterium pictum TaxID=2315236 RepID=UPI0010F59384|nr:hypothetical protein [Rubrivivax pictus]
MSLTHRRALALVLLAAAAATAGAQTPAAVLAGPSVIKLAETATVSGNGLPANSAVTVVVTAPGGAKASFGAVTDPQGRVSHRVAANASGRWEVAVHSSAGAELARTTINFLP